jgi:hypothetical protein
MILKNASMLKINFQYLTQLTRIIITFDEFY